MFIDVHAHLSGDEYESVGGVAGVLSRASEAGVAVVIASGFDLASSLQSLQIAKEHENVYFCAGFHPSELAKWKEGDLERLREVCLHPKCVAVGEIGLDYHFENNPSRETQRAAFVEQLQLANELGLPVVIHSRDAAEETLELLQEHEGLLKAGGLMHCYSYSPEMLLRFAKLGLHFSFGGTATFKNAKKVHESVRLVPAHRILSETDCPYLTPTPYRGVFPNEPKHIPLVVKQLAELRQEKEEHLEACIWANACALFPKLRK